MYINDLPESLNSLEYLFADDTKPFRPITRLDDVKTLQQDIDSLQLWSANWVLNYHPDKLFTIDNRRISSSYQLKLNDKVYSLECVNEMKDLGVTIDSRLNFNSHIKIKVNNTNQTMGMIRRAFTHLDKDMFLCLFKAFVWPQLEYANALICHAEIWQRYVSLFVQSICSTATPICQRWDMPRGDMIETYTILSDYNENVSPILNINTSSTKDNTLKLLKPSTNKDTRRFSFINKIVDFWNQFPSEVVTAKKNR